MAAEYSLAKDSKKTSDSQGVNGLSKNSDLWDKVQETGAWSHYPDVLPPKSGRGFYDPIQAGPVRDELWDDRPEPGAPDESVSWIGVNSTTPGTLGQRGLD